MGTEKGWVYRVDEPYGSQGWRPYGGLPERWRVTVEIQPDIDAD